LGDKASGTVAEGRYRWA